MEKNKLRPGPGVYVRVCKGNFVAGSFLYHMAFQMQRARRKIEGKRWYVRPRQKEMDYWGCSERQYKNAMRFLRNEGLIETRYTAGFGSSQAWRTTAFRLTEKAENEIAYENQCWGKDETMEESTFDADKEPVTTVLPQHSGRAAIDPTDRDNIGPTDRDAVSPLDRDAVGPTHYKESKDSDRDSEREGKGHLRRQSAAKKPGTILRQEDNRKEKPGKISEDDIEKAFRGGWVKFIDNPARAYWAGWPRKNFRAGRQFVERILERVENGRDIDPLAVIDECVSRWKFFREYAFDDHSHKLPEAPNMLSLLGGIQPAIAFYLRQVDRRYVDRRYEARPKPTLAALFSISNDPLFTRPTVPQPARSKEAEIDSWAKEHLSSTQTIPTTAHGPSFADPRPPLAPGADSNQQVDTVIFEEELSVEEEDDPGDMPSVTGSPSASPENADVAGSALAAPKRKGIPVKRPTKRPQTSDTLASFALSIEDEDDPAVIPSAKTSMSPHPACAQGASLASSDLTKPKGIRIKLPKKKTLTT